ncbi:MAG: hypothetical protein OEV22_18615 [Deltaproteobacteria bacterium]|jgi:hypothetical protein|nr:hypothetical protein [Deltaproteobacteria bacterium]
MHHPETIDVIYASNPKGGLVTINKADYDPELHILEGEAKPAPKKRGRPRKIKEGT